MKLKYLNCDHATTHTIRLVTRPHQYHCHRNILLPDGNKAKCGLSYGMGVCPFCICETDGAYSPNAFRITRFLTAVISRADEQLYFLDMGYNIFSGIRDLARDPEFGNPIKYDITISNGYGRFDITACPKTPLSVKDEELIETIDPEWMMSFCDPPIYTHGVIPEHKELFLYGE